MLFEIIINNEFKKGKQKIINKLVISSESGVAIYYHSIDLSILLYIIDCQFGLVVM